VARPLADDVELPLESDRFEAVGSADEELLDPGLGVLGGGADVGRVDPGRHAPPAEQLLARLGDQSRDGVFALLPLGGVGRQEDVAGRIEPGRGQRDLELVLRHEGEELVRQGRKDARAVAGILLTAAGAAMVHVDEHLARVLDDLMRPLALDVRDEPHAAAILFIGGVVEAVLLGRADRLIAVHSRHPVV
jgi:hypothetical protein